MKYNKPELLHYRVAQIVSWFVATFIFRRKFIRNELKKATRPFVVIANHEAALDFVNLIGASKKPMSFVVSSSFFNTLPVKGFMTKMGVIPKSQFQTSLKDLKQMKSVVDHGDNLVIYPAGLMCEDGLSTPIPQATYKFLKMLDVDVYVAKTIGTYFVMPKWTKGFRPGRTYMDIYKLFSKEELHDCDLNTVQDKVDEALLFDAYRDQETHLIKYKKNTIIEGLENVLYICPHCFAEFSIKAQDGTTLTCEKCGFSHMSDEYAFLHNRSGIGPTIRYVSDWSKIIYAHLKEKITQGRETLLTAKTKIHMIDFKKNKFKKVGEGILSINAEQFTIEGTIHEKEVCLTIPTTQFPTLPFKPGKYLEIQHGSDIYRCVLEDGRLAMKFINMVKIFYETKRSPM